MSVVAGFSACSNDDTPNDIQNTEEALVNLTFASQMQADINSAARESRFTFSSGSISIEDLIFRISNGEQTYEVDVLQGSDSLFSVDLLTGIPNYILDYFEIPTGEFHQIEIELITGGEESVITGVFVDDAGEEYPIEVVLPEGEPIVLRSDGDFLFLESRSVEAAVVLNPRSWVSRLSSSILERLETNEDGVIVISETMNSQIFYIILESLKESSEVEVKSEVPTPES